MFFCVVAPPPSGRKGPFARTGERLAGVAGGVSGVLLGGCRSGVLAPEGPVAASERVILLDSLAIMLAIVIPLIGATIALAWWFRASNPRARHLPDWSYSGRIELVVWSVPAMVVIFLGGVGWVSSHDLDPQKPLKSAARALDVQVVSLDWKWLFIYPESGVATINQLVLPSGVPVSFHLTSATVMNSFFVPQLGSQIYTMAGMATRVSLQADRPGTYAGLSAQFSGDGFSDMRFAVKVVPGPEFRDWIKAAQANAPPLDESAYAALAQRGRALAPMTYRATLPGLFDRVVTMRAPAAGARPQTRALVPTPAGPRS